MVWGWGRTGSFMPDFGPKMIFGRPVGVGVGVVGAGVVGLAGGVCCC